MPGIKLVLRHQGVRLCQLELRWQDLDLAGNDAQALLQHILTLLPVRYTLAEEAQLSLLRRLQAACVPRTELCIELELYLQQQARDRERDPSVTAEHLRDQLASCQSERNAQETELVIAKRTAKEATQLAEAKSSLLQQAERARDGLARKNADLMQRVAELEPLRQQLTDLETEVARLNEENRNLRVLIVSRQTPVRPPPRTPEPGPF